MRIESHKRDINTRGSPRALCARGAVLRGQRTGERSPPLLHLSGVSDGLGESFRTLPRDPRCSRLPGAGEEGASPLLDLTHQATVFAIVSRAAVSQAARGQSRVRGPILFFQLLGARAGKRG